MAPTFKSSAAKLLLTALIYLGIPPNAEAQTSDQKNSIYGNLGMIPVTFAIATVNYERFIAPVNFGLEGSISGRLGYGSWGSWGSEGNAYIAVVNFLSGSRKGHFELGLGAYIFSEKEELDVYNHYWTPGINAGYRYTSRYFIFRAGASWPETIFLGLGVQF